MNLLKYKKLLFASGVTTFGLASITAYNLNNSKTVKKFSYEEVEKYNNVKKGIYVTYKDSVYDVTDFVNNHPGGKDKILLAAGKSIDKYWNLYPQHINNPDIYKEILTPMKVGILENYKESNDNLLDLYIHDPIRDLNLNFHSIAPCNAETPIDSIIDNYITPNEFYYIRNHHPVPHINIKDYKLEIAHDDNLLTEISVDELKNLPKKEITSTMQCGGNRRSELTPYKKTSGIQWDIGAISTAKWGGVQLKDILIKVYDNNFKNINHVHFESYDGVIASIPIEKVLNNFGDVLIAYQMNDDDIPLDHGYPIRIIVPGYVGIRSVKWLKRITLSKNEADGIYQQGVPYKSTPHYITNLDKWNIEDFPSIQELPVQSCITNVEEKENKFTISGYSYSGGGRNITRVDVSTDNGITWQLTKLTQGNDQGYNRAWAWTFWELDVDTLDDKNILVCKAVDSSLNTQTDRIDLSWNFRGLSNNSWHKKYIKN